MLVSWFTTLVQTEKSATGWIAFDDSFTLHAIMRSTLAFKVSFSPLGASFKMVSPALGVILVV